MLRTSSLPELPVSACCSGLYIWWDFLDFVVAWLPVPAVATASLSGDSFSTFSFSAFSAMASLRSYNVSAEYCPDCSVGPALSSEPACY